MEERGLLVLCALLTLLSVVSVSGQFGYGDRFSDGVDDPYGASGGGGDGRANAVDDDIACPDFGPMDSFNAEGLQRGKVGKSSSGQSQRVITLHIAIYGPRFCPPKMDHISDQSFP